MATAASDSHIPVQYGQASRSDSHVQPFPLRRATATRTGAEIFAREIMKAPEPVPAPSTTSVIRSVIEQGNAAAVELQEMRVLRPEHPVLDVAFKSVLGDRAAPQPPDLLPFPLRLLHLRLAGASRLRQAAVDLLQQLRRVVADLRAAFRGLGDLRVLAPAVLCLLLCHLHSFPFRCMKPITRSRLLSSPDPPVEEPGHQLRSGVLPALAL